MKTDWTITISKGILIATLIACPIIVMLDLVWGISCENLPEWLVLVVAILLAVAMFRLMIVLWFQTFIHVLQNEDGRPRLWWALAHAVLGPAVSWIYYDITLKRAQQKAAHVPS